MDDGIEWIDIGSLAELSAGPLGQGRLDGDYVVCPCHGWKFHRATGEGEPG
ncbi:MAG: Rieske 2Fe-2S domain-containing protein, partial [Thermoanaerobaculia bacterium]